MTYKEAIDECYKAIEARHFFFSTDQSQEALAKIYIQGAIEILMTLGLIKFEDGK